MTSPADQMPLETPEAMVVPPADWFGATSHRAKGGLEVCTPDEFAIIVKNELFILDRIVRHRVRIDKSTTRRTEYSQVLTREWDSVFEKAEANWAHVAATIIGDFDPSELLATNQTAWFRYTPDDKESKYEVLVSCELVEDDDDAQVEAYQQRWRDQVALYESDDFTLPRRSNSERTIGRISLVEADDQFMVLDNQSGLDRKADFSVIKGVNSAEEFAAFVQARDSEDASEDLVKQARSGSQSINDGAYDSLVRDMGIDFLVNRAPDIIISMYTVGESGELVMREAHDVEKQIPYPFLELGMEALDPHMDATRVRELFVSSVAQLVQQKVANLALDAFLFDWASAVRIDVPEAPIVFVSE